MSLLPGTRTRAKKAWAAFVAAPAEAQLQQLVSTPALLRPDVLDWLEAEGVDAEALHNARQVSSVVSDEHGGYPLGGGPLEALFADVRTGRVTIEQARLAAQALPITEALVPSYVTTVLSRLGWEAIPDGGAGWRASRALGEVALAAVDACDRNAEPAMRRARLAGAVTWAHGLLTAVPDGPLLRQADEWGRSLVREYEEAGDVAGVAGARFALAGLWSDCYQNNRTTAGYEQQDNAWRARGFREHTHTDGRPPEDWAMPDPVEALRVSLDHWRAARQAAPDNAAVMAGLAEAAYWLFIRDGTPMDEDALDAVAHGLTVVSDDPAESSVHQRLVGLARIFGIAGHDDVRTHVDGPSDDVAAALGDDAAAVIVRIVMNVRRDDPAAALRIVERHAQLLIDPARLADELFQHLVWETVFILGDVFGHEAAGSDPDGPRGATYFQDHVTAVLDAMAEERMTPTTLAAVCLRLAARSPLFDAESGGLALLRHARQTAPLFAARWAWVFDALEAELFLNEGVNHVEAGDHASALIFYTRALTLRAPQGRLAPVRELLGRIADLAAEADDDAVVLMTGALVDAAPTLMASLGAEVDRSLAEVWRGVLEAVTKDPNSEMLWAVLQFAKGLRTAMSLSRRRPVSPRDDAVASGLLDALDGARSAVTGQDVPLPLGPRRAFEARYRVLAADTGQRPELLALSEARHAIDERTVLVSTGTAVSRSGVGRLLAFVVSDDDQVLAATQPIEPGEEVPFVPEALFDVLDDLRGRGKDHLCIIGHAGSQVAPWHLLAMDDGRALAEDWVLTTLPHPHLLWQSRSVLTVAPSRPTPVVAFGRGFDEPRSGFDPIPGAVHEAKRIAERLGGIAFVDGHADEERFREEAPLARCVHIATHGVFDPETPWFHEVLLAPSDASDGRLHAWEVADLVLADTRLVTLSACETARMAVDEGDNLAGLPIAFLCAGARAVIGTLWPVETNASQLFFEHLYDAFDPAGDLRDPFRSAQAAVRAAFPDPEHWGAFYFLGDWRAP